MGSHLSGRYFGLAALALAAPWFACATKRPQVAAPEPPRLLAIDHVSFWVSNLAAARAFYRDLLGLAEVASSCPDHSAGEHRAGFRVSGTQWIEIREGALTADGHFGHLALAAEGMAAAPRQALQDPDGHAIEIVPVATTSATASEGAPYLRIAHVGFLAGSLGASLGFYRDGLGFQEFWRGGGDPRRLDWVNLRVPGGEDYVELMLYEELPKPEARGGKNHVCLFVVDAAAAIAAIEARPARKSYPRPIELRVGRNRKRQVNLFDPDGTRVELMEPHTIDGAPAPPSSAPPPRP